jgi:hypothetical protein
MRMIGSLMVALLAVLLAAPAGRAADPAERCEARKLRLAAQNAACRLRKDAQAALRGTAADHDKCQESFARQYGKAEEGAGPGVCPTENDRAEIEAVLAGATSEVAEQLAGPDGSCPPGYWDRTPTQVVQDLLAAYGAQNATLITCNYHPSAFAIDDQGVLVGHADIVAAYLSLSALFNGVSPQVLQLDEYLDTVRLLWRLDAGWVVIEDGVDTFVIQRGRIRKQTRHGLITFTGPPPDPS